MKLLLSERTFVEVEAHESSDLDSNASVTISEVNSNEDLLFLIEHNQKFTHNRGVCKIMLIECVLLNTDLSSNTNEEKAQLSLFKV